MKLEDYLNKFFHFNTFRPGQKEVITSILDGFHTMAMLPTGTGKSLCYQLSGYLKEGASINCFTAFILNARSSGANENEWGKECCSHKLLSNWSREKTSL